MSVAPEMNALVDKPDAQAVSSLKTPTIASTKRKLKTQPNAEAEPTATDKASKLARPSSNRNFLFGASVKKRSTSGLAEKQSPFLQNIYRIYEGTVAQERKSIRSSKRHTEDSSNRDPRCREHKNSLGIDPRDNSIANCLIPSDRGLAPAQVPDPAAKNLDPPLDTIHELDLKPKQPPAKKPELCLDAAKQADKKDRKAAPLAEKDLAASPQTQRHVALLFGSKADNFRQKLQTETSKSQLSKTAKNTKPFYDASSNKVSKRSVEKPGDSPSKLKRESPPIPCDAQTPETSKPVLSSDYSNFYLQKNSNKPNISKDLQSTKSKFASLTRVNRKSSHQHHLLKTRSQVYDENSAAKQEPGQKEPKDKSERFQSRQKSASNLRTIGTFSKKDLEKSAGRVSKELSSLHKTPSQVFSRPKPHYSENLKSSQSHYRDSYKYSKDKAGLKSQYQKKEAQKDSPDKNPGLRLIQDLGFVEHLQGKNDLLGGSTAETVKKPHQKVGSKKEKFEAKRRETQTESDQFKRDFSINFKALMDMKGLKKHVMAIKASSHQKILGLFKTANSIDPELYYLYHLFQACKHSLEAGSSDEDKDKDKLKALEHYSQNVIGFTQTKPHRSRSLSDYIAKRFELSNYESTRMTLLFDLDETLAHCQQLPGPQPSGLKPCPPSGVKIRPHAFEVIRELKRHFEVGLFTSSTKDYADAIIKIFDPKDDLFDFRLYRDSCVDIGGGLVAKDLRVIKDRDAQSLFIVDNNTFCFGFQLNQGIPILPFTGDDRDNELTYLLKYLKRLATVSEPSKFNCRYFGHDLLQTHCENVSILPRLMLERIVEISESGLRHHL